MYVFVAYSTVLKDKRNYCFLVYNLRPAFEKVKLDVRLSLEPFKDLDGRFDPSSTALTKRSPTVFFFFLVCSIMAAGRIGFSVALWFLVFLCAINHPQIDGEGYRVCEEAWKIFKHSIYQPSAMSGSHRFVPTHHRNFYSSSGFITGLLLLCGDIISQPGPTKRTQFGGVPLKGLVINARSMKKQHKVGTSRVSKLDRVQDLVYSEHADIVLISETWLNGNILDQELFPLSDFIVNRKDRNMYRFIYITVYIPQYIPTIRESREI